MGFLHNHAKKSVDARNQLIQTSRISRIINFSDLRFQLFEGASRPAALFMLGPGTPDDESYSFEYWAPKADLNLQIRRFITLSSTDKATLRSDAATADEMVFKRRLWMREPDAKLFNYLSSLPRLGELIKVYGRVSRRRQSTADGWIIGDGFKQAVPNRIGDEVYDVTESNYVGRYPFLPINRFKVPAISDFDGAPWHTNLVHRRGFEEGIHGARILVPRGVEISKGRIRASFTEQSLTFFSIIQAITVPKGCERQAKLLTALLNSRIFVWFAFHGTSSFGSDRPEIQKTELLRLPFPKASDLPQPKQAEKAADELIKMVDQELNKPENLLSIENEGDQLLSDIDALSYKYFCLSRDEIAIIEDTITHTIPATQPHEGSFPVNWPPFRLDTWHS